MTFLLAALTGAIVYQAVEALAQEPTDYSKLKCPKDDVVVSFQSEYLPEDGVSDSPEAALASLVRDVAPDADPNFVERFQRADNRSRAAELAIADASGKKAAALAVRPSDKWQIPQLHVCHSVLTGRTEVSEEQPTKSGLLLPIGAVSVGIQRRAL